MHHASLQTNLAQLEVIDCIPRATVVMHSQTLYHFFLGGCGRESFSPPPKKKIRFLTTDVMILNVPFNC